MPRAKTFRVASEMSGLSGKDELMQWELVSGSLLGFSLGRFRLV